MEYKYEAEMLEHLRGSRRLKLFELAALLGVDQNTLMRPLGSLEGKGLVRKEVKSSSSLSPTEEGKKYLSEDLPEIRVYKKALAGKGIQDLAQDEKQFGIKWAREKGLVEIQGGKIVLKMKMSESETADYSKNYLSSGSNARELIQRGLAEEKTEKEITLEITP